MRVHTWRGLSIGFLVFQHPIFIVGFNLFMASDCGFFLKLSKKGFLKLSMIIFEVSVIFEKGTAIVVVSSARWVLFVGELITQTFS